MVKGVEWAFEIPIRATDSFANGLALLDQGVALLRERTSLPVYTASYAVHDALTHLESRRVGIVTPFDESGNQLIRETYEERGFEVASMVGLNRPGFDQIANTSDDEITAAFETINQSSPDALVQVGTGLPTLHLIEALEEKCGRPVVTSNQASYWKASRASGLTQSVPGAGSLLR